MALFQTKYYVREQPIKNIVIKKPFWPILHLKDVHCILSLLYCSVWVIHQITELLWWFYLFLNVSLKCFVAAYTYLIWFWFSQVHYFIISFIYLLYSLWVKCCKKNSLHMLTAVYVATKFSLFERALSYIKMYNTICVSF